MKIIEQKYKYENRVFNTIPSLVIQDSRINQYHLINNLSLIPQDSIGASIIFGEDVPSQDQIIELLCNGNQLLFPEKLQDNEILKNRGCHFYRDMEHLPEIIKEITKDILNLTFETRFFTRDKYRVREELVTVIIATHNDWDVLNRSLESLVNQAYKTFEVILVNDDPSENSRKKVEEISRNFLDKLDITLVNNQKNVYQYVCRNVGISLALGKYITFLDTGDVFTPDRLKYFMDNRDNKTQMLSAWFKRLRNINDQNAIAHPEYITFCYRSLYKKYGFYDPVKVIGDCAFSSAVEDNLKKTLPKKVTYLAIGINMSLKYQTLRVQFFNNVKAYKTAHPTYFNRPFSTKPYPVPKEILITFDD